MVNEQETLQNNIEYRYRRLTRDVRISRQWCASQRAEICESAAEMGESAGRDERVSRQWCACQQAVVCVSAGSGVRVSGQRCAS